MMKKAIALLMGIIILASMIVPVTAEETELSMPERFALNAGFISSTDYHSDDEVTRAEFAGVLVRMLGLADPDYDYQKWQDHAAGNPDDTLSFFEDVDESHPYYYEIQLVRQKMLMVGISDTLFAPEFSITEREAAKVLLDRLGWGIIAEKNGGYPKGYETAAASSGLLKSANYSAALSKKKLAKMLYDMLDIKLVEVSDYSRGEYKISDDTFLTGALNGGHIKGILSDNGFTAIDGASKISVNAIKVGGVEAKLPNDMSYVKDYLGRQVEMYYINDDSDESTVLYIEQKANDEITFDIKDFESYHDGVIRYNKDRARKVKILDKNVDMIINNEFVSGFDESAFDFDSGDVTLLKDSDGKYSLIVVNRYEFALVSSINTNTKCVYNKIKGSNVAGVYDFSEEDSNNTRFFVHDAEGNKLSFSDIKVNDVLNIRKSASYTDVVRTSNVVSDFTINGTASNESIGTDLVGTEGRYRLTTTYENASNKVVYYLGKPYTLYLTMFGDVLWIDNNTASQKGEHIGVLARARKVEDAPREEESRYIRIFGDDGKLARFWIGERIVYNNSGTKFDNVVDKLMAAEGSLVRYTIDDNAQLAEICTANEFGSSEQTGWYRLAPTGKYYYGSQGGDLENLYYVNKNTTLCFTAPEDSEDYNNESNFSVNAISLVDNKEYTMEAYAKKRTSVTADAIVLRQKAASAGTIKEGEAFFIQKIVETINAEGDAVPMFMGYAFCFNGTKAAEYREYVISEDAIMIGFGGTAAEVPQDGDINEVGPRTYKELSAGDIIYYDTNIKNEIDSIRIAYDYSTGKAFDGGRGSDHYAPENAGKRAVAVNSTWAGGAVSVEDNGLKIAVCGDPSNVDFSNFDSVKKNVKAFVLKNTGAILVADMGGGSVGIKNGTPEDIVAYENSGAYDNVVVMTYWSSGHYGTVIYKE